MIVTFLLGIYLTAGIADIEGRKQFYEMIQKMALSGKTIIISTHYLKEVDDIIDRAFLLHNSHIMEMGLSSEDQKLYFLSVRKKYNIDFLENLTDVDVIEYGEKHIIINMEDPTNIDNIFVKLNANGIKVIEFYKLIGNLHDTYLSEVST